VLTRGKGETRLFLDGNLQFSTLDEYRYHEALVHPGLAAVARPSRVLVLGGGDGLAAREILRDPRVETLTLVDLDPVMTSLFRDHDELSKLNGRSLRSPKVQVVNADAFVWLGSNQQQFDFIAIDFPDPRNFSLGKLYTSTFYRRLTSHLAPGGIVAIQSTSPLFARRAFWCIVETIRSVGLEVRPYHAAVPSFGEWGFVLAAADPIRLAEDFPPGLRFLDPVSAQSMFEFPRDMQPLPVEINQLNNQVLVHYHSEGWKHAAGS
jgi:spermidine synthase